MTNYGQTVPCRVGFVGAGSMIREHIRAFADVDGVELVGIANRTLEKARELAGEHGIPAAFENIESMCTAARPDLLVLAVYETGIRSVAEACLDQDVALFTEKPFGIDISETRHLAALARERDRRVWIGLNRRAYAATRRVVEDLDTDPGRRFIHVQDAQSLAKARSLRHAEEVVRNWMFTNSVHLVDYLAHFARGSLESVDVILPWVEDAPDVVVAKVAFSSGDIGLYEAHWSGPGPWACAITTARRRWEMRPLERAAFQDAGERELHEVEPEPVDTRFKAGFRVQAEWVVRAWRGEETAMPTLESALATSELVASIYTPSV